MIKLLKKIIPKNILNLRHLFFAWWGSVRYQNPSEELLVIGITGTSGKTSTIHFLRQVLEMAGFRVGSLSTADFYIDGELKLNDKKMTMVGRYFIQEKLRQMLNKKCDIAIVETTSEGFLQYRHKFINYDTIVLTNLYPEHIESHGGFKNYKAAKLGIFEYVSRCKRKNRLKTYDIRCKSEKMCVVNCNNEYYKEFLGFNFENKITFGFNSSVLGHNSYVLDNVEAKADGLHFTINNEKYFAPIYGEHNAENLAAVVALAKSLNISEEKIKQAISQIKSPPGRIEFITEAEEKGFKVIVDYAFEPVALEKLYNVVNLLKSSGKIIHVCGSTGGGRDQARRKPIGRMVAEKADIFFVTDEDPYDEDPMEIIKQVSAGAQSVGKKLSIDLFEILDRREAIKKAIQIAKEGDLVLVTGKGSEQKMCVAGGKMIDWDDREIVREALKL